MNVTTVDVAETMALPRWDLSKVYPGLDSDAFQRDLDRLRTQLDDLDAYLADQEIRRGAATRPPDDLAVVIAGYIETMNAALRLHATLRFYAFGFVATDSRDDVAARRSSEIDRLSARLQEIGARFTGWLGEQAGDLAAITGEDPVLARHGFFLRETVEQSRFLMSESEESLAAELALSGQNAWSRLQTKVVSSLEVLFERGGTIERIPMTAILNLARDPDPDIRRRAYEAEIGAWETVGEPLAAALNGVKGATVAVALRRGRRDVLHEALDKARIDQETLDVMLGAVRSSFPVFRRYLRKKAERLGEAVLPWWDLYAPLPGHERRYSFAETRDLVHEQFPRFSARLAALARRAFDERWIDAGSRPGKAAGAFTMPLPAIDESRVFSNFDGSLYEVMTLVHELGHAFHVHCQIGKTELQKVTPMTLAETASIFNERIVIEALLSDASSNDEQLRILETQLMAEAMIIVDTTSRFLFEREVFERRSQSELSTEEFCDVMLRAQADTYGDGLDERHRHPYMWAWKPHYYQTDVSFYNFPYVFGLLFGIGLWALYKEHGDSFIPEYEAMLSSSGEGTAMELAARFGIDLHRPEFWQASLKAIEERVEQYLAL